MNEYIVSISIISNAIVSAASISTFFHISSRLPLFLKDDFIYLGSNGGHREFSYDNDQID